MQVIDLSKTIENGMDVYHDDPVVEIEDVHLWKQKGWKLQRLRFGSHSGTHVDAPSHMSEQGLSLDQIPVERFFWRAYVAESTALQFRKKKGLIFREGSMTMFQFDRIRVAEPLFIAVGDTATLDIALEKNLLAAGILTFTDLIHLSFLPEEKDFMFFGVPLKIKNGDGSPVRAFAIIDL